jgi:hypothetical protein
MNRPKVSRLPWALCLKRLRGSATLGFDKDRYSHGLHDHPWSFTPLRPERVVEVRYEHMEGIRFRHTAQFNRARFGDGQGGRQMRRPGAGPGRSGWPRILVA